MDLAIDQGSKKGKCWLGMQLFALTKSQALDKVCDEAEAQLTVWKRVVRMIGVSE
jgi:hypothetical protein